MRIEKTMNESGRVRALQINLELKKVSLESDLGEKELIELFDKAGYDAVLSNK